MAESITQSDTNQGGDTDKHKVTAPPPLRPSDAKASSETSVEETSQTAPLASDEAKDIPSTTFIPTPTIIWTPSFIVIFALVLVFGLSAEGLVTEGWVSHFYPHDWTLLAHVLVVLGLWITIVTRVPSRWVRIGGLFAFVWAFFAGFHLVLGLLSVDYNSPIISHLNAATAIALLGSYICLSLDHTPFHIWDARFFRFVLIVGIIAAAAAYLLMPPGKQSLSTLESDIEITALVLSLLVWWIRPSCWKAQPGPTFLFGMVSAIILFLTIPNGTDAATHLFLSQVAFLCNILGALRILQIYKVQSHLSISE